MLLSVVIVNYKVPLLAEQTICSVLAAFESLSSGEVLVVDNASGDGSVEYLTETFAHEPRVRILASDENLGFSRGNNLALRQARGEYLLLLNPDTMVGESTLGECIDFLREHPDAGAVGPKLIDIAGRFHPESKRGLPTPWAALCRLLHLYKLAPQSAFFNGYYQGHLCADVVQQVPILTGAFLMMSREVMERVGLLDEQFFMYGEDIDLCYRIEQAGYKNYYLPLPVLHYKGESEQAAHRVRYHRSFYGAMRLFYLKHRRGDLWSRIKTPIILFGIRLQQRLAELKHDRTVADMVDTPSPALIPTTIDQLWEHLEDFPPESHLLITLSETSYDRLLDTMQQLAADRYTFHFRSDMGARIISPKS